MKMPIVSTNSFSMNASTSDSVAATSSIFIIGSLYFSRYSRHIGVRAGGVRVFSPCRLRLSATWASSSPVVGLVCGLFDVCSIICLLRLAAVASFQKWPSYGAKTGRLRIVTRPLTHRKWPSYFRPVRHLRLERLSGALAARLGLHWAKVLKNTLRSGFVTINCVLKTLFFILFTKNIWRIAQLSVPLHPKSTPFVGFAGF